MKGGGIEHSKKLHYIPVVNTYILLKGGRMKKLNLIGKSIFLLVVLVLCTLPLAGAEEYEIAGRPFFLNGFIQQEAALGVDNSKFHGRNVTDYFMIQLEWEFKLTDSISLYGINRTWADLAYSLHHDRHWFERANRTKSQKHNARKNLEWEWDRYDRAGEAVRELYFDIFTEKFHFRIGKQQVVWGESDGLRLMDFINPQDLRREFNLRDSDEGYEYTRIPLWLIRATYFPNIEPAGIRDLQIEFIINPGKPKTNRLEAYESDGGVWATEEPNLPWGVRVNLRNRKPRTLFKNFEYAMRIMGDWNGWLFTLNAFYGLQHDFYLTPKAPSPVIPRWDRAFLQLNFDQDYSLRRIIGFTVNKELTTVRFRKTTSPVLRVEALYEFNKPFQYEGNHAGDMAWTGLNSRFRQSRKFKDQIRIMLGLDWNIYIRPLNKRESFFLSAQFFMYYIRDKNGEYVNAPFYFSNAVKQEMMPPLPPSRDRKFIKPWRIHQTQKYLSFLINSYYDNKRILPQVLYLFDMEEKAHGLKAKINFFYTSHWRPEIGCMMWWGDHDTGKSLGLFQKNRQVYMKIKYQF